MYVHYYVSCEALAVRAKMDVSNGLQQKADNLKIQGSRSRRTFPFVVCSERMVLRVWQRTLSRLRALMTDYKCDRMEFGALLSDATAAVFLSCPNSEYACYALFYIFGAGLPAVPLVGLDWRFLETVSPDSGAHYML